LLRLHRHLPQDSGLSHADYVILAALSEHPAGRMPAQELCASLQWEKSRLSHQVRRMQEQGLIDRGPNPADARSAMICLLPAGRRAIQDAAPDHVRNLRRHFIDLLTPAELDMLAALDERVLRHLAEEPFPDNPLPAADPRRARVPEGPARRGPRAGRASSVPSGCAHRIP
jgi:DNA-binding MarR family transcriptional regulator